MDSSMVRNASVQYARHTDLRPLFDAGVVPLKDPGIQIHGTAAEHGHAAGKALLSLTSNLGKDALAKVAPTYLLPEAIRNTNAVQDLEAHNRRYHAGMAKLVQSTSEAVGTLAGAAANVKLEAIKPTDVLHALFGKKSIDFVTNVANQTINRARDAYSRGIDITPEQTGTIVANLALLGAMLTTKSAPAGPRPLSVGYTVPNGSRPQVINVLTKGDKLIVSMRHLSSSLVGTVQGTTLTVARRGTPTEGMYLALAEEINNAGRLISQVNLRTDFYGPTMTYAARSRGELTSETTTYIRNIRNGNYQDGVSRFASDVRIDDAATRQMFAQNVNTAILDDRFTLLQHDLRLTGVGNVRLPTNKSQGSVVLSFSGREAATASTNPMGLAHSVDPESGRAISAILNWFY